MSGPAAGTAAPASSGDAQAITQLPPAGPTAATPGSGASANKAVPASDRRPRLVAPECTASRPALATTGELMHLTRRIADGGSLTILAIGSSTTSGVGTSSPAAAYPARLESELERRLPHVDARIVVSGVGGETASQTLARLVREVENVRPDLVIWQVGTNDALADVPEQDFRQLVEQGVAASRVRGADLILLDQQFFPSIRRKDRYERFVSIVRDVGLKKRACVFGRYALMKDWGEASSANLKAMLADDGFHMSDRGHACMARILADEIVNAALAPHQSAGAF